MIITEEPEPKSITEEQELEEESIENCDISLEVMALRGIRP